MRGTKRKADKTADDNEPPLKKPKKQASNSKKKKKLKSKHSMIFTASMEADNVINQAFAQAIASSSASSTFNVPEKTGAKRPPLPKLNDEHDQTPFGTVRNITKSLSFVPSKSLSTEASTSLSIFKASKEESDVDTIDKTTSNDNGKSLEKVPKKPTRAKIRKTVTSNPTNDSKLLVILLGTNKNKKKASEVDLQWCTSMEYEPKDYAYNSWVGYLTVRKKKEFTQYINDNKHDNSFYTWCKNSKYFKSRKNPSMTRFDHFAAYMVHEYKEFDETFEITHKHRQGTLYFNTAEDKATLHKIKTKHPKLIELEKKHDVLYIGLITAVPMIGLMLSGKKNAEIRPKTLTKHVPMRSTTGKIKLSKPPMPKKIKHIKEVPTRSDIKHKKRESQKALITNDLKDSRSKYNINWSDLTSIIMFDYSAEKVINLFSKWIFIKDIHQKNKNQSIKKHNDKLIEFCKRCLKRLEFWTSQPICYDFNGINDNYNLMQRVNVAS